MVPPLHLQIPVNRTIAIVQSDYSIAMIPDRLADQNLILEKNINNIDYDTLNSIIDNNGLDTTKNLDKFKNAILDAIKIPNMFVNVGPHDTAEGDQMLSDEHVKVKLIVDKYWSEATPQQKMEYYNALKTSIVSSKFFLQHCYQNNIQVRVVQNKVRNLIDLEKSPNERETSVYLSQLGDFYDKAKDFYLQATNVKFIGSIINIANMSSKDGIYINIQEARRTSTTEINGLPSFDLNSPIITISNRDVYTKFIPPTMYEYTTRSITEILSNFIPRDDWNDKKEIVYNELCETFKYDIHGVNPDMIKKSGRSFRCQDTAGPLGYDDVYTYKAFKDRCGQFASFETRQPGRSIVVHDTYIAVSSLNESTDGQIPYSITEYGIFLLDKSLNENINTDYSDYEEYRMLPYTVDQIYYLVERILDIDTEEDAVRVHEMAQDMMTKAMLTQHGTVVRSKTSVKPYKGEPLMEGESIIKSGYTVKSIV